MPLTPNFSISQSAASPAYVLATDTSVGSDIAVVSRRIFFQKADGTYIVPSGTLTDYILWSAADATILINLLTEDEAVLCTVQWLNVGNTVLYTLSQYFCLIEFNKQFFYSLISAQAATPSILQDANYFSNMATYWMNITGAIQAIEIGSDISGSANCVGRATYMMNNANLYF